MIYFRIPILFHLKRYEDAILEANANPNFRALAATSYAAMGRYDEAHSLLDNIHPGQRIEKNSCKGQVFFIQGSYDEALRYFEKSGEFMPAGKVRIAQTLEKLGDYRSAAKAWERAILSKRFRASNDLAALARCYRGYGQEELARKAEALIP